MDCGSEDVTFVLEQTTHRKVKQQKRQLFLNFTFQNFTEIPLSSSGSRSECSHITTSDTDLLYTAEGVVITSVSEQNYRKCRPYCDAVRIDTDGTHPGYCKLALIYLSSRNPEFTHFLSLEEGGSFSADNLCTPHSCYLSNKIFIKNGSKRVHEVLMPLGGILSNTDSIHGPCLAPNLNFGCKSSPKIDFAFCIPFDSWPHVANEWPNRKRLNNWPCRSLIQEIMHYKCCCVPIGYSDDDVHRDCEWRISFNEAERLLTWSFNPVQMICFDFLKLILAHKIRKHFPEGTLCSYFMKTLMYWLIEGTPLDFWKKDNLIDCIRTCVMELVKWLQDSVCPHYFIRSNNMFDKKDKKVLGQVAMFILSMDIGAEFNSFVNFTKRELKQNIMYKNHIFINAVCMGRHLLFSKLIETDPSVALLKLTQKLKIMQEDAEVDKYIAMEMKRSILTTTGSVVLCKYLDKTTGNQSQNDGISIVTMLSKVAAFKLASLIVSKYMAAGQFSDVFAGTLKLATMYWCLGQFDKVLDITKRLRTVDLDNIVYYSFYDKHVIKEPDDESHPVCEMSLTETMRQFVALDVIFVPSEMKSVPEFIQYQLSDGYSVFMAPVLYCNILEFTCYLSMNDTKSMVRMFDANLGITDAPITRGLPYITTDLIGYCAMKLGKFDIARLNFEKSISQRKFGKCSKMLLDMMSCHSKDR